MRRTPIRRIRLALASCLSLMALRCGGMASDSPTAPSGPPAPGATIMYTAVGASDATGHGASVECFPFADCPNGTGYVPVTARELRAQGFAVTLLNLGIPTAVIGRDFETLGSQYNRTIAGNFIDQEMPFVAPNSTIVTVFAAARAASERRGDRIDLVAAGENRHDRRIGRDERHFLIAEVASDGADVLAAQRPEIPS